LVRGNKMRETFLRICCIWD